MHEFGPLGFWALLLLIVVVSAIFGTLGVVLAHRALAGRVGDRHNDVLVPIYATAAVIYAVLLAFIVIAVWEQFTGAQDNVADESSALTTMYRETQAMPHPEQRRLRVLLRDYTEAVIGPEWKAQEQGGASPAARTALIEMYSTIDRFPPTVATTAITQEFVTELAKMSSDRNKRTLASEDALPWILWFPLIAGGLVVIAMGWFLFMESVWIQAAASGAVAVLIGVLLFTTLVLDKPFHGRLGIKPEPFEHAVSVYDSVDRTP